MTPSINNLHVQTMWLALNHIEHVLIQVWGVPDAPRLFQKHGISVRTMEESYSLNPEWKPNSLGYSDRRKSFVLEAF